MGICDNPKKKIDESKIIKEICILGKEPIPIEPTHELYSYKSLICKIVFQTIESGKVVNCLGTGFFCEINNDKIPFKKALFTNNHALEEKRIEINKEIEFEYLNTNIIIKITKDRRKFTNVKLDYTCMYRNIWYR